MKAKRVNQDKLVNLLCSKLFTKNCVENLRGLVIKIRNNCIKVNIFEKILCTYEKIYENNINADIDVSNVLNNI